MILNFLLSIYHFCKKVSLNSFKVVKFLFIDNSTGESSFVIIFSVWKALVGSAIVSLPWAFQQSGLVLGFTIAFTSFSISYYTSSLVVHSAKNDENYSQTC